jgi:hypothetical protein
MSEFEIRNRFEIKHDNISDGWVQNEESDNSVPSTPPNSLADPIGEYMKKSIYCQESDISDITDENLKDDTSNSVDVNHGSVNEERTEYTESDDYDEEDDENRVKLENSDEEISAEDDIDPPVEYIIAEEQIRKRYNEECPPVILMTASMLLILWLVRSICFLCLFALRNELCICKKN